LLDLNGFFGGAALLIPRAAMAGAPKETAMKKTLTALVAAATVVASMAGSSGTADARNGWVGPAIAGGIIGGAIIGGAIASSRPSYAYPGYAPVEGYVAYPQYAAPVPVGCPGGYWGRRFAGYDRFGTPVYSRPRWFCPY
jgi:hypothetical protein